MALRDICMKLGTDRRFREWARPLDPRAEAGAAYVATLKERGVQKPMELATLLHRVNDGDVATSDEFARHLDAIVACADAYYYYGGGGGGGGEQLGETGHREPTP